MASTLGGAHLAAVPPNAASAARSSQPLKRQRNHQAQDKPSQAIAWWASIVVGALIAAAIAFGALLGLSGLF
jgi:hypothetical protein